MLALVLSVLGDRRFGTGLDECLAQSLQACDSVIHVLDRMLLPPLPNSPPSAHQINSGEPHQSHQSYTSFAARAPSTSQLRRIGAAQIRCSRGGLPHTAGAQPDNSTLALLNIFNSGHALRSAPTPALGCCSTAPATTLLVTCENTKCHRAISWPSYCRCEMCKVPSCCQFVTFEAFNMGQLHGFHAGQ